MKHLLFGISLLLATPASALGEAKIAAIGPGVVVDLSHGYGEDTIYWPTAAGFEMTSDYKGTTEGGYYYEANSFCSAEHGGTHLDAPIHFAEATHHADEIPLDRLIGPAVLIDVTAQAAADRNYRVTVADFESWEAAHGRLPDGVIVLMRTGFSAFWPDAGRYLGTAGRGPEAVPELSFPGLHPDAASWLVEHRAISAIGLDTASIDHGPSTGFESHRILFAHNIPAFENVANLERLPPKGFHVIALPMKVTGGSGGPLRIVAVVPTESAQAPSP